MLHCANVSHILYAFICSWVSKMFLNCSYQKQNSNEHSCIENFQQVEESFGYMAKSWIGGSWINLFLFFCETKTDYLCGYPCLPTHQQGLSLPLTAHLCDHELTFVLLILAILTDVRKKMTKFLFVFPLWLRMLNISISLCQPHFRTLY